MQLNIYSTTTVHPDGTYTNTPPKITPKPRSLRNRSSTWTETNQSTQLNNEILDLGLPTLACTYCGAFFWKLEALKQARRKTNPQFSLCCQLGKVGLPLLPETPTLLDNLLSVNGDALSKHFRTNIRSYNASFSWTSFGAKLDPRLLNSRGPYSLVLCGENYHYMGSLLPPEGQPPRYAQLYVNDPTTEVNNRLSANGSTTRPLNPQLMAGLQDMLDTCNVLTQSFRRVRDALQEPTNHNLRLRITGSRVERDRMYELPTGTELAGLIPGDFEPNRDERDIIVNNRTTGLTRITSLNPLFDSLHFPLLFPHGNDGFHQRIRYNPLYVDPNQKRKYVTQKEYYCFRLQYRRDEGNTLIRGGKALQHFCIDAFTTIEQNRLTYLRFNQKKLRSDIYKGLHDALNRGDLDSRNLGRIINPSTFTGSVRYMQQLYLDAMAVCHFHGNPDLFITFTCNAQWPELIQAFRDDVGPHSEDKPMLVARGMHTVEFQKRGLPHVHIVMWLAPEHKPTTLTRVDAIISAELPDPTIDPIGYDSVTKFMVHGPCGDARPSSPCMKDNKCSKFFPKPYASETTFDDNGYVTYRRRPTNISVVKSGEALDNAFVVPYNRDLVVKYQAHINVEICHKGQLIKYLFKYITKGPDRSEVTAEKRSQQEISQYLDCRSISSYEAVWRLFSFPIHERSPAVFRLCVHLPGEHTISFEEHQTVDSIVNRPDVGKTMLTEWFTLNQRYPSARKYTYSDITHAFVWDKQSSQWVIRKKGFVIGRIASIPPRSGDVFYLRMLLTKIPGALSFEQLRTVNGHLYQTYQQACQALGLLSNDTEWNDVMMEVSHWGMPSFIRSTFVSLLMFCNVSSPQTLFEQWWPSMADDFKRRLQRLTDNPVQDPLPANLRNEVLHSLQSLLQNYSSSLSHFNLPLPTCMPEADQQDDLVSQQLQYDIAHEAESYTQTRASLNNCQATAHDAILRSLSSDSNNLFFLYGHGGTGKTYLYNCIISKIRSEHKIALVVASSGIAATLLPGGVTAHSRFKIPIEVDHASTCAIKKGTNLARLMQQATLIVWDEAPMVHRLSFEAVDRTLCDIMNTPTEGPNYKPFGGKTVILGGDFRQTLPIVKNGGREDNLGASLVNMRINHSISNAATEFDGMQFSDWVLAIGDGKLHKSRPVGQATNDWITIPRCFIIPSSSTPVADLVTRVYPNLQTSYHNVAYIRSRAIVTPTNKVVSAINDLILTQLPGEEKVYLSADTLTTSGPNQISLEIQYPTEFLNSLSFNGMPEHQLRFKPYTIVMLLRNLNPSVGLLVRGLIVGGSYEGTIAIIPRIVLDVTDQNWPFTLRRRQYPLRLCYAMTINKSQGQTLDTVGLYLPTPVFSHGQLYVAVSRVRSAAGIFIVIENEDSLPLDVTRNIVYDEIFEELHPVGVPFVNEST
ncbi:ATP-dependent DNA helicase PIF1 [Linum perenne]